MKKTRKIIFFLVVIICIVFFAFIVYGLYLKTPSTVLKYKSDDRKISVVVSEPKTVIFAPASAVEYTILVKQKESFFKSNILLKEKLNHSVGINDNDIDIKWNKSSVEITVHDNKKKSKNTYKAEWE